MNSSIVVFILGALLKSKMFLMCLLCNVNKSDRVKKFQNKETVSHVIRLVFEIRNYSLFGRAALYVDFSNLFKSMWFIKAVPFVVLFTHWI